MKKKFIILTMMLLTLLGGVKWNVLNAQETITIGEDSQCAGFNILPNNCWYNYSITQQIYTSDELGGAPGVISTIAFRSSSTYDFSRKFKVYMLNTSKGTFEDKIDMVNMTDDNLVYNGNVTYVAGGEWMVLQLNVPFNYTGENLILCVCDYSGTYKDSNNHFYVFDSGENRSLYKFTDNAAFDPSNIQGNNQQAAEYQVGMDKKVNQLQIVITSASASVKVSAESISLGDVRLGNYWTEKNASANVEIKAIATTITSISCDNNFFTLNYDLNQNPVALNVSYNKEANVSGAQNGNITITSADCEPVVIPVTATAYTPANGDVYENPITVNFDANNSFTAQATGMYDDYILPDEAEDGNLNDAVYKFTLANDGVVTANVNGTNAIAAIYKAEDLQGNGPSSNNNYNGIVSGPTTPTTFFFDFNDQSLEAFNLLDANNDGYNWDLASNAVNNQTWGIGSFSYVHTGVSYVNVTPDNYIYTKDVYSITDESKLTFIVKSNGYADKYAVVVSEDGETFENVYEETYSSSTPKTVEVNLSEYADKALHIGFRHFDCTGQYAIFVDDVKLTDGSAKSRAGENQIDGVQYPAGTYYLVAAADGDFTLNLSTASLPAPESFAYTAPENNTIVEETNPELSWKSSKYATSYDVYLGTTSTLTESDLKDNVSTTSFQTTGLSNNTKYYWQVVAKNSVGNTEGAEGDVWSFVTPLDVPQNVTASSNNIYPDNNNVTITWDAVSDVKVKGYNVWVKVNGDGNAIKHNGNELVTTAETETTVSYELSNMDYSKNGHEVYVTAVYEIEEGKTYESNMSATQTIKVTDYVALYGTITDGTNPIAGAKISLAGTDEFGTAQTYTFTSGENGVYGGNVLVGSYTITVSRFDYKTFETTIEFVEPGNSEFPISMESNPVAEFTVNAEEGRASWDAEYASYNVYRRDSEGNVTSLKTEVKAEEYQDAEWETLADGEYEYGVSAMMVETSYVTETFSTTSIPEGWTQNGEFEWSFNGTYAYLFQSWTSATPNNLITPLIDLSNESAPTISFKYSIGGSWTSSGYYNTLKVEVSESLNGPWTNIFTSSSYTSGFVNVEKSLSAFAGKKVYVKFVTDTDFSTTYIDDVVLPNTTSSESRINWSAPVEKGGITFTGDGYWNDEANWSAVPNTEDKVTIKGNATITENVTVGSIRIASGATLTVKSGVVLNVTNGISNTNAAALVMEDGAQIHQPNANVAATFNMNIINPTKGWGNNKDGWQFISSPLLNAKTSAFETSGENNDFDLYKYDGTKEGAEWVNYKDHQLEGDTFFYDFSNGMQGWTTINANADSYTWGHTEDGTGKNFTYGAPNGYNGEKGCLFSDAVWYNSSWQAQYINPNDYVVSPERVMIVKDSKLSFYIQSATNNYSSGEITVLVSESENASADSFVQIHSVNDKLFKNEWFKITISLAEYAGKEVWIAIRHNVTNALNSYILIDNLELTDGKTRSGNEDLFETEFVNGRAYLASYQAATTAKFEGTLNNARVFSQELSYYSGDEKPLANFHLLGNPFTFDMDMTKATYKNLVAGVAIVDGTGGYTYVGTGKEQTTIPVGDGFFVKATAEGASFKYNADSKRSRSTDVNSINIIASGKAGKDNVVVNFAGKSEGFDKLQNFNDEIATVYVAEGNKHYGIYNCDEDVQEIELAFEAKEMGSYTMAIEADGKFQSVTLVDRFTGIETNMLMEDYHFTATSGNNTNRFVIRLANGQEPTANSQFVYQNGEELILTVEGAVQIVDVMGRVVYNNEVVSDNNRIDVSSFLNGTYIVRVINEEGVKAQKVVIY